MTLGHPSWEALPVSRGPPETEGNSSSREVTSGSGFRLVMDMNQVGCPASIPQLPFKILFICLLILGLHLWHVKFSGPEIEPMPQWLLQRHHQILSLLCHKGTPHQLPFGEYPLPPSNTDLEGGEIQVSS